VRAHALTLGVGASLPVVLRSVLPSKEDPAQFFRATNDLVTITPNSAPTLFAAALPAGFGGYVSLLIRPAQPASPVSLIATLSVELSLKD